MNYGELKKQITDLGFSDENELKEFGSIVPNAINRAITEINMTVAPIIGVHEITQTGSTDGVILYDMEDLTKDGETIKFLEFADTPVMVGKAFYKRYNDFEIENEKILVMDGSIAGTFKVFYKKAHSPFTTETDDKTSIELPLKTHYLLPLLASYYIWLEDEKSKAVDYYNQYEALKNDMLSKRSAPRARIMSGGI